MFTKQDTTVAMRAVNALASRRKADQKQMAASRAEVMRKIYEVKRLAKAHGIKIHSWEGITASEIKAAQKTGKHPVSRVRYYIEYNTPITPYKFKSKADDKRRGAMKRNGNIGGIGLAKFAEALAAENLSIEQMTITELTNFIASKVWTIRVSFDESKNQI